MNACLHAGENEMAVALASTGLPFRDPPRSREDGVGLRRQLGVVQEMIATMDTQTVAGQRYTMDKIVAFLGKQIEPSARIASKRTGRSLSELVSQLAREAQRMLPDVQSFSDRAQVLIASLLA